MAPQDSFIEDDNDTWYVPPTGQLVEKRHQRWCCELMTNFVEPVRCASRNLICRIATFDHVRVATRYVSSASTTLGRTWTVYALLAGDHMTKPPSSSRFLLQRSKWPKFLDLDITANHQKICRVPNKYTKKPQEASRRTAPKGDTETRCREGKPEKSRRRACCAEKPGLCDGPDANGPRRRAVEDSAKTRILRSIRQHSENLYQ